LKTPEKCKTVYDIAWEPHTASYKFQMFDPKPRELRIVYGGDSVTMGATANIIEEIDSQSNATKDTDNSIGR